MKFEIVQDLVLASVVTYGVSSSGWHSCYCEYCGDGARTKGPRGGWNFTDDMCFYHCFNCGMDANFDPKREFPYSKEMHNVFQSFGIQYREYNTFVLDYRKNNDIKIQQPKKQSVKYNFLDIPDYFVPLRLTQETDDVANLAKLFLKEKKHINYRDYEFYISSGKTESKNPDDISKAKYLRNRLIIPVFKDGKMLSYQARDLTEKSSNKYIGLTKQYPYGIENLYKDFESPLFITEGFFDSFHLNGMAVLENHLPESHVQIINNSPRRKIVIPDRFDNNDSLAEKAIELGWEVALPDIGNCKDIIEAIEQYGKVYTLNSIVSNIYSGDKAKTLIKTY